MCIHILKPRISVLKCLTSNGNSQKKELSQQNTRVALYTYRTVTNLLYCSYTDLVNLIPGKQGIKIPSKLDNSIPRIVLYRSETVCLVGNHSG